MEGPTPRAKYRRGTSRLGASHARGPRRRPLGKRHSRRARDAGVSDGQDGGRRASHYRAGSRSLSGDRAARRRDFIPGVLDVAAVHPLPPLVGSSSLATRRRSNSFLLVISPLLFVLGGHRGEAPKTMRPHRPSRIGGRKLGIPHSSFASSYRSSKSALLTAYGSEPFSWLDTR